MHMRRLSFISSIAALSVLACGKDALPPPAPSADPIASPTSLARITVTGSAQYGTKITITGGASVDPAAIVADPFTARFLAVVTLTHNAKNTLVFTATDRSGRVSAPTTVNVEQSDAYAASIQNMLVNGVPCAPSGTPPTCVVTSGDVIDFDVVANSTVAVSEVQYTAFFSTAGGSGTLRSQRVLVAPNSPLPYVQHFVFNIPGTLIETVPIEALVIDAQGNRFTSQAFALRVNNIDALGRAVAPVAVGRLVNGPNDVAFDSTGNLFIANDGVPNLLKVPATGTFPAIFSDYRGNSGYLTTGGAGNLYLSDLGNKVFRVAPDGTVVNYLSLGGGIGPTGLTTDAPTVAKGLVTVGTVTAGNTITVGAKVYEFQPGGVLCSPGNVCVDANATNKTQAFATAVQASSAEANAAYDAGSGKAVISAKSAGPAGNAINFTTSNTVAITLTPTGGKLGEGHDENLFAGQAGAADTNIYRFSEGLTALPAGTGANEGAFSAATQHRGLAVRDLTTASSTNLRDLVLYFVDDASPKTLRAVHAVDSASPTALFSITPGGGGGGLYDVVMLGNGCLLVSDEAAGKIYSVDTRSATTTAPAFATVASGFKKPRGLAVYKGDLYVADNGFDAVVRISPLAAAACF